MEIPGYEIERCIGQGGMASAYLARQTSLDRKVVLKVLDTSITDSPVTIERFLNEGRIVASLHHPHIITTYDIGRAGADVYISMEYVDGGDLKERLLDDTFDPVDAVNLVARIASALAAAHAKGIVHRDVKPGNILFRADGTPLLGDFGIAKRLGGDANLTSTGMFVGSPNYMAPEQSDEGPIDGRADIYALGVIFYEMLTGRKAYLSESVIDIILKHKNDPVPTLPAEFSAYQELLDLMMAKDRNERFRDANALLHFIERMKARGLASATIELAGVSAAPDAGGAHAFEPVVRTRLAREPHHRMRLLLTAVAVMCAAAYGTLLLVERRMNDTTPPVVTPVSEALETLADDVPPGVPMRTDGEAVAVEKVVAALTWLGNHSLNEYRLTAPPKDNAYYYFSRLLQIDPGSEAARRGLLEISSRYALLAERAIADGEYERARAYVTVGLQVNPQNETLMVLRDLARPARDGILAGLFRLFDG